MYPLKSSLTKKKTRRCSIPQLKNVQFFLPNISSRNNSPIVNKSPSLHALKIQNKYKNLLGFGLSPNRIISQLSSSQNESSNKKKKILVLKPIIKYSPQKNTLNLTKRILLNNNVGIPELKEIQRNIQEKIYNMNEKIEIEDVKIENYIVPKPKPNNLRSKSVFLKKPKYKPGLQMELNVILKKFTSQNYDDEKTIIAVNTKKKNLKKNTRKMKSMANATKIIFSLNEKSEKCTKINNDFRQLSKKNVLFDSLDEDEFEEEEKNKYMEISILPESVFIFIYDILLLISTFYLLVFTPYFLARKDCFCDFDHKFLIINIFIDILFILDIVISFFRGYYDFEFNLVK